jgi:hypothetical protein
MDGQTTGKVATRKRGRSAKIKYYHSKEKILNYLRTSPFLGSEEPRIRSGDLRDYLEIKISRFRLKLIHLEGGAE